jgi:UDP-glucose 4-epimerase
MGTRRPGDPPALINSPALIQRELGWTAKHRTLDAMIATAWAWRSAHPAGYAR